ncbi:hypothetical protein NQ317_003269 [Molorchus minor]|uniref:Methylenetetrahydrofolate reductase (NAD(P)H) n=1 Tax=Molorchus minor TaxID=1323400 RepID=A0ABQ9JKJ6_9CUCU|nr:hypothetical protein NQ317_003269 [Molorchus minor]
MREELIRSAISFFSVEICTNRELDTNLLAVVNPSFCSVTWHTTLTDLRNVEGIPAISLGKELLHRGYNVLLHLAGRNLNKCQVLAILNLAKRVGVINILALQGAGYPEKHPKSKSVDEDIRYLKEKVSNGVDFIITQATYDFDALKNSPNAVEHPI